MSAFAPTSPAPARSVPALIPAASAVPLAPWIGGKRYLSRLIVGRISAIPHRTYCEPFVGMGGVFFRRPSAAHCEVINDASRDVINLFRVVARHEAAFVEMLRWQLTSRDEFERQLATDPQTLTDLERALRFLFLQRTAFGGKVVGQTFGVEKSRPVRFDPTKVVALLKAAHQRLARVVIERLTWQDCLRRYDSKETLFYLDPPYAGSEGYYGKGLFGVEHYAEMAEILAHLRGRFLLSINDTPLMR